jgi:uncharacterized protein (TIGR03000 family)
VRATPPATITVRLPAEAALFFDDVRTKATSESRTFTTPALQTGKVYYYTVKAEVDRDGQRITSTHQIQFRAGQTVQLVFNMDEAGTLTARQE